MRLRSRATRIFVALTAVLGLSMVVSGPAGADEPQFEWLCKPGRAGDPCVGQAGSLLTTTVTAAGASGKATPKQLTRLKDRIDCFYVYPTVSSQAGPNATLAEDPEIDGIAEQQAARFAPGCRMFAPIYRQYTVPAILGSKITEQVAATAYNSVKAAWDEYLSQYNDGRGIVLIGHSQGTGHLKQLIAETFDKQPELRSRLISAVLIGGNVAVAKGQRTGGDFTQIPACAKKDELGCVIAFSSFLENPPPENSLFARLGGALSGSDLDPATHEVMCVNPAELDGSGGVLKPLYNTKAFPGAYGPLLPDLTGYPTPWVSFPSLYSASCEKTDGASWLKIHVTADGSDPRPRIGEPLGRTWGTHLTEVNDTAGNLVSIVTSQEAAYVDKLNAPRKKALQAQTAKAKKLLTTYRKQSAALRQQARKAAGSRRAALKRRAATAARRAAAKQRQIESLRKQIARLDPLGS